MADISAKVIAFIMGIVGIIVLIAVAVNLYPTFNTSLQTANTSGMQFGSVILALGGIIFGLVILVGVVLYLLSLIKSKG